MYNEPGVRYDVQIRNRNENGMSFQGELVFSRLFAITSTTFPVQLFPVFVSKQQKTETG